MTVVARDPVHNTDGITPIGANMSIQRMNFSFLFNRQRSIKESWCTWYLFENQETMIPTCTSKSSNATRGENCGARGCQPTRCSRECVISGMSNRRNVGSRSNVWFPFALVLRCAHGKHEINTKARRVCAMISCWVRWAHLPTDSAQRRGNVSGGHGASGL